MTMTMDSPMTAHTGTFHQALVLSALRPSKTNPRKHFDETKLRELANSLLEHGVIEPLIVRQIDAGSHKAILFEIVAGERRFLASKLAGLATVPAIERLLTDEQVVEIQLIENIQRDDLTALEQARGYQALIASNREKHTAATIATRVGMSEAWVWDRLKLNDLIPGAKALLEQERIATGHAILIARQKPADQKRIIDPSDCRGYGGGRAGVWQTDHAKLELENTKPGKYDGLKAVSVRELESWIADHIRFDVTHAAKAVPLEFGAVAQQITMAESLPGRGKKVIPITFSYHVQEGARDANERTYGVQSWKRADGQEKSKTCEASVLGVVVAGSERYGQTIEVCIARDKCRVHWGKELAEREKNQKLRDSGQGKKADRALEAQRKREERDQRERDARETRFRAFKAALQEATLEAAGGVKTLKPAVFKAMVKDFRLPPTTTPATLAKVLLLETIKQLYQHAWFNDERRMVAWAKLLGVDVKACEPKPAKKDTAA